MIELYCDTARVTCSFWFTFFSEAVIEGLDRAVLNMKKGEIALVTIPPEYAYGSTESKQDLAVIPANSTLIYEVELVSFVKVCFSLRYACALFCLNILCAVKIMSIFLICRIRSHGT
jgi:hypothetical protein